MVRSRDVLSGVYAGVIIFSLGLNQMEDLLVLKWTKAKSHKALFLERERTHGRHLKTAKGDSVVGFRRNIGVPIFPVKGWLETSLGPFKLGFPF